jgi:hypothetical protein
MRAFLILRGCLGDLSRVDLADLLQDGRQS